jgi:cell fate regulator YaaT (PSP1 superfamily)
MAQSYLVRHGLMGHVGRFWAEAEDFERGQTVVIRSRRGIELGEILLRMADGQEPDAPLPASATVLRLAGPDDFERARRAELDRPRRFEACERVFHEGIWPIELIDVEPLLDDRKTVLHYLGPHHLDTSGLVAALRARCDLEIYFEPAGRNVSNEPKPTESTCGHCGSDGGCGIRGGCGARLHAESAACSSCAIKSLLAARR